MKLKIIFTLALIFCAIKTPAICETRDACGGNDLSHDDAVRHCQAKCEKTYSTSFGVRWNGNHSRNCCGCANVKS